MPSAISSSAASASSNNFAASQPGLKKLRATISPSSRSPLSSSGYANCPQGLGFGVVAVQQAVDQGARVGPVVGQVAAGAVHMRRAAIEHLVLGMARREL